MNEGKMLSIDNLIEEANELRRETQRLEDVRLKYLEIAAQMMGPQQPVENEPVQQYLDRYIALAKGIELNITGHRYKWPTLEDS